MRKKSMFTDVSIKLWYFSTQPEILAKTEFKLDISEEAMIALIFLQGNFLDGIIFTVKLQFQILSLKFQKRDTPPDKISDMEYVFTLLKDMSMPRFLNDLYKYKQSDFV